MLSPPHTGAFDGGVARQVAPRAHGGGQPWKAANEETLGTQSSPPSKTKSRARSLCTWKYCQYRGRNTDEMRSHSFTHRQCPKDDCEWANAKNQSEKDRHVWSMHKAWAEKNQYPSQSAICDECQQTFSRRDRLPRHKREVHGAQRRMRRPRG
ncbi:hypothetical protein BGZ63DRAFT_377620 [Mariannaea sp. PMI_226]|nr:hypothetical protein BGZ63DRAFT_377620 [Mariannaea sp. PMI_226]